MKSTFEKAQAALPNLDPEIILTKPLRKRAEAEILRMLELSRLCKILFPLVLTTDSKARTLAAHRAPP